MRRNFKATPAITTAPAASPRPIAPSTIVVSVTRLSFLFLAYCLIQPLVSTDGGSVPSYVLDLGEAIVHNTLGSRRILPRCNTLQQFRTSSRLPIVRTIRHSAPLLPGLKPSSIKSTRGCQNFLRTNDPRNPPCSSPIPRCLLSRLGLLTSTHAYLNLTYVRGEYPWELHNIRTNVRRWI